MGVVFHKAIVSSSFGALIGVFAARHTWFSAQPFVLIGGFSLGVSTILLAVANRRRAETSQHSNVLPTTMFILAAFICALGCSCMHARHILARHSYLYAQQGERTTVIGTVSSDPTYHKSGQFEFFIENTQLNQTDLFAKIKVRSFVKQVQRGDKVTVSAKLYDGFASWQGSMYFAEVTVLEHDRSPIAQFRSRFMHNIYSVVPDPEASLGLGFLIGVRSLLPDTLVDQLSTVGLTHIVAVSGYNLTILVAASRRLLGRFSRFQSLMYSCVLIASFVMVTGWSPSILRAVVVSGVGLLAWYYNRSVNPWLLILYSSSLSAVLRPVYVWYDIGWFLSLTAFIGVLIIAPLLQHRIYKQREPGLVAQTLLETSAAQMVTMPVIMYVFGELSLIALLSNLIVLPLIPLTMLSTFLTGMAYFLSFKLAWILMWPTYLLLAFVTNVTAFLAQVKWALVTVKLTTPQLMIIYMTMLATVFLYTHARKNQNQSGIIEPIKPNYVSEEASE